MHARVGEAERALALLVAQVAQPERQAGPQRVAGPADDVGVRQRGPQLGREGLSGHLDERFEHGVLGAEMLVEEALGDAGGLGHVLHAGRLEAHPSEDLGGRVEDAAASRLGGQSLPGHLRHATANLTPR